MSLSQVTCCETVEACPTGDCSGLEEVQRLLPKGRLWKLGRPSQVAQFFKAIAFVKSCFNRDACQEYAELNPKTSSRLLPYWADVYYFPDCLELTQEKFCEWFDIITDQDCPAGSIGFLRRALEFVAPDKAITLDFNPRGGFASKWHSDITCPDDNVIVVSAPPECFYFDTVEDPLFGYIPDGENACRRYFIPEIECLRKCIFPYGVSLGYKTDVAGPDGETIYAVPDNNIMDKPRVYDYSVCEDC